MRGIDGGLAMDCTTPHHPRNGRDWHPCLNCADLSMPASLISMASTIPAGLNHRLLLGMKGSISEFQLGVLRARMLDAARPKASTRAAIISPVRLCMASRTRTWI
jgi:hypothetical protein